MTVVRPQFAPRGAPDLPTPAGGHPDDADALLHEIVAAIIARPAGDRLPLYEAEAAALAAADFAAYEAARADLRAGGVPVLDIDLAVDGWRADAYERQAEAEGTRPLVLSPRAPLESARQLLAAQHTTFDEARQESLSTLRHWCGEFYCWNGACYRVLEAAALRAAVYNFLDTALKPNSRGHLVPFAPRAASVTDVVDALAAAAHLSGTTEAPAWLAPAMPLGPATDLLPLANGLLHLPSGTLYPPTAALFSTRSSPVRFDPKAGPPAAWLRFLETVWPDDQPAIDTLQEIFGYLLAGGTEQQKVFLLVGPRRRGKGTVGRVLTDLLGPESVAAPTLAGLSTNFGLAPLIDRPLAIIGDARLSGRADQSAIAERLLSISGEDSITVDRKYMPAWTGRLPTRFLIMSNELPRLADASGALASRFVVLTMQQSFYGREDLDLHRRLLRELPAILLWSLRGYRRLQDRGHFVQPPSSADAIEDLEALGSPISAFVRDCCRVAAGAEVETTRLYAAWVAWCSAQGRDHPGIAATFGRDLRAAVPGIAVAARGSAKTGDRRRAYLGIGLE